MIIRSADKGSIEQHLLSPENRLPCTFVLLSAALWRPGETLSRQVRQWNSLRLPLSVSIGWV